MNKASEELKEKQRRLQELEEQIKRLEKKA